MSESICILCQYEISNKFVMRCGHKFHNYCINNWLKQNSKCPQCLQPISKSKAFENLLHKGNSIKVFTDLSDISINDDSEYTIEIIKILSNEIIIRLKLCALNFDDSYSSGNILRYAFYQGTVMIFVLVGNGNDSADIEVYDEDDNLLNSAIKIGHSELVQILLQLNYYVNGTDSNLMTPLHWACQLQNIEFIRLLLAKGANIEEMDGAGYRPIHYACKTQNLEVVKVLIKAGADLNKISFDYWSNPLNLAISLSNFELARLLITSGANVNGLNEYKHTALHAASSEGIACFLIDSGANVNRVDENGCTALHHARNANIIRVLIQNCASVNDLDNNSTTKLHMICRRDILKSIDTIEIPFDCDLKIDKQDVLNDQTALEMAKILIEYGAALNVSDCNKNTPLHLACKSEFVAMVQLLVDSGADVGAINENGSTPLSIAIGTNNNEIFQILNDAGAVIGP